MNQIVAGGSNKPDIITHRIVGGDKKYKGEPNQYYGKKLTDLQYDNPITKLIEFIPGLDTSEFVIPQFKDGSVEKISSIVNFGSEIYELLTLDLPE